nr:hypothetical protein [uncultured Sphingomonas sp.]
MLPEQKRKLYTPLNMGAFELQHRIVLDCGSLVARTLAAASPPTGPVCDIPCGGGMVLHAIPVGEVVSAPAAALRDRAWVSVLDSARASRQVAVALLTISRLSFPFAGACVAELQTGVVSSLLEAASWALDLGFVGVELDAHTFPEASADVLLGVLDALIGKLGAGRIGVRLTAGPADTRSPEGHRTLPMLQEREIAYVHLVGPGSPQADDAWREGRAASGPASRRGYAGILVASAAADLAAAELLVESRWADAICFPADRIDTAMMNEICRRLS